MKTGQPKIRTQPPSRSAGQDALKRLEKLSDWTEEPARDIAASLNAPMPAKEHTESPQVKPKPEKRHKATEAAQPWQIDMPSSAEPVRSMNFKLPTNLYRKLKWLGETTYGTNMTKIVIEALEEKTAKMLKERGVKP